eukprot:GGOE01053991.1.p1 GENE.GGOE01053991.1~~GGOE01053991.1.p1  ORF type:complete len:476 (+),score=128.94 GGOE01053991.1:263-1690(+)
MFLKPCAVGVLLLLLLFVAHELFRAIVPASRRPEDAPGDVLAKSPLGKPFASPLADPTVPQPSPSQPVPVEVEPTASRGVAGRNRGLCDVPALFHSHGYDAIAGAALAHRLQQETGLRRLIATVERLLFPDSSAQGVCKTTAEYHRSGDASNLCLSPEVLGARPSVRSKKDAFPLAEVAQIAAEYRRHTQGIQVTHSKPSYPLITGDGFKFVGDFQCDTKPNQKDDCSLDPRSITNRSIVFINTLDIPTFVAHKLPRIDAHFFVITHNRDKSVPGPEGMPLLHSPKLLRWFAKNIDHAHPKMVPIPIGIENRFYRNGEHPEDFLDLLSGNHNATASRDVLINFTPRKWNSDRSHALEAMKKNGFGSRQIKKVGHKQFLDQSRHYRFILSPQGNGISCHRTWEALYMGCLPLVSPSNDTDVYAGLPVVVVEDWFKVTKEFVDATWTRLAVQGRFDWDRLWQPWWLLHLLRVCLLTL